jgi:Flp pilus assembly protein TadD
VSVRFSVLLALAFGAAVAYLASLNTRPVRVAVTADWAWDVPLAALRALRELSIAGGQWQRALGFQKAEVRAPNLSGLHAVLGAIFERRGQTAEAFDEYRRALTLDGAFDRPYRCAACGAEHGSWTDRCPSCRSWNTSRP